VKNKKYLLMVIIILILVGVKSMPAIKSWKQTKSLENSIAIFIEFLENADIEELSLRVYDRVLLSLPEDRRDFFELELKRLGLTHEFIVDGLTLSQYVELFKEIENTNLVPVRGRYEIESGWCFVFETESDGVLLEVCIWAFSFPSLLERITNGIIYGEPSRYMIVNGVAIKENQTLYDMILPFLPEFAPLQFF